jgi:hypothetical protein
VVAAVGVTKVDEQAAIAIAIAAAATATAAY